MTIYRENYKIGQYGPGHDSVRSSFAKLAQVDTSEKSEKIKAKKSFDLLTHNDVKELKAVNVLASAKNKSLSAKDIAAILVYTEDHKRTPGSDDEKLINSLIDIIKSWKTGTAEEKTAFEQVCSEVLKIKNGEHPKRVLAKINPDQGSAAKEKVLSGDAKTDDAGSIKGDNKAVAEVVSKPIDDTTWSAITKSSVNKETRAKLDALLAKGVDRNNSEDVAALIACLKDMEWPLCFINIALSEKYLFSDGPITNAKFQSFCKDEIVAFSNNVEGSVAGYEGYTKGKKLFEYASFVVLDKTDKPTLDEARSAMEGDSSFTKDPKYYNSKMTTIDMISSYVRYKGASLEPSCYKTSFKVWGLDGKQTEATDSAIKLIDVKKFTEMVKTQKTDSAEPAKTEVTDEEFAKLDSEEGIFSAKGIKKGTSAEDVIKWLSGAKKHVSSLGDTEADAKKSYAWKMFACAQYLANQPKKGGSAAMPVLTAEEKDRVVAAFNDLYAELGGKEQWGSQGKKKITIEDKIISYNGLYAKRGLKFKDGKLQSTTVEKAKDTATKKVKTEADYLKEHWIPCKKAAATTTKTNFYLDPNDSTKTLNYYVNGKMKKSGSYTLNGAGEVVAIEKEKNVGRTKVNPDKLVVDGKTIRAHFKDTKPTNNTLSLAGKTYVKDTELPPNYYCLN